MRSRGITRDLGRFRAEGGQAEHERTWDWGLEALEVGKMVIVEASRDTRIKWSCRRHRGTLRSLTWDSSGDRRQKKN